MVPLTAGFESEQSLYAGIQWGQLWQGANLRRTLISMGVQCLQQAQGISFMNNYLLVRLRCTCILFSVLDVADFLRLLGHIPVPVSDRKGPEFSSCN